MKWFGKVRRVAAKPPEDRVDDRALVLAARDGDKRAFVEIVARHQAMVCGTAYGILGDFAASEDAAQEAFLTAWRNLGTLRDPEKLRSWLCQIARNTALGALRKQRETEPLAESAELEAEGPRPDQAAASEDEAALVRSALARLPEKYRIPLILFYCEGQSASTTAKALDLSEEAVRQRLSRGREMLREGMSSLVEEVLGRSRPTGVFTMGVAAAIGALAAPAAVAAAAFSAGSATAAAATASTTESIIAAMSTTKVTFGTTAVVAVLCIPLGYQFRPGEYRSSDSKQLQTVLSDNTAHPIGSESELFAEWRKLHDMHGTTAEAMPNIWDAISKMEDPVRRRAFEIALVAEWAELDPTGGFRYFTEKKGASSQRRQLFDAWLAEDAETALDALLTSSNWESLARGVLSDVARLSPNRLGVVVSRLPEPRNFWDASVRDAFIVLAESHLQNARLHAEQVTGPNREQALAGVAKTWGKSDLEGAMKWAEELPDGIDRAEIKRVALTGKATVDPVSALENLDRVPPGGRASHFATTAGARILKEAAAADFDSTVQWMATHPGRLQHDDLMGLSEEVTKRLNADPVAFLNSYGEPAVLNAIAPAINSALLNDGAGQRRAVWEWLETQGESPGAKQLRESVLNSAAYQEPELALELAADRTPASMQERTDLARALLNHGAMMHRFDTLYEKAPASMKPALAEAAFSSLRPESNIDPGMWVDRLSLLPEGAKGTGVASLARAWAGKAPEEALAWVSKLPQNQNNSTAVRSVIGEWAQRDFQAAAQWVGSLDPGTERDQRTEALVLSVAGERPEEAWDWALSIQNTDLRRTAALSLVGHMRWKDPAQARAWIASGPFDEAMQKQLLARLEVFPNGGGAGE